MNSLQERVAQATAARLAKAVQAAQALLQARKQAQPC